MLEVYDSPHIHAYYQDDMSIIDIQGFYCTIQFPMTSITMSNISPFDFSVGDKIVGEPMAAPGITTVMSPPSVTG